MLLQVLDRSGCRSLGSTVAAAGVATVTAV
jgi:hypothetical protein